MVFPLVEEEKGESLLFEKEKLLYPQEHQLEGRKQRIFS